MYESFYGLKRDPFRLLPDHSFAFAHDSYARARSHLEYGLLAGEGIVVITGAPGTGKSVLVEDVLSQYGTLDIQVAHVLTPQPEPAAFLRLVASALGVEQHDSDRTSTLIALRQHLQASAGRGRLVLLVVDEAQNLTHECVEALRLLTNIHAGEYGLQLILLGQPALRDVIRDEGMEQLRQRIIGYCHLAPLSPAETRAYVLHRLETAGWSGDPEISGAALAVIHQYSRGVPRRINLLCSRLLLAGFTESKHRLDAQDAHGVVAELAPEMVEAEILAQQGIHAAGESPRLAASGVVDLGERRMSIGGLRGETALDLPLPGLDAGSCTPCTVAPETPVRVPDAGTADAGTVDVGEPARQPVDDVSRVVPATFRAQGSPSATSERRAAHAHRRRIAAYHRRLFLWLLCLASLSAWVWYTGQSPGHGPLIDVLRERLLQVAHPP